MPTVKYSAAKAPPPVPNSIVPDTKDLPIGITISAGITSNVPGGKSIR
jgi:hypothetical protein